MVKVSGKLKQNLDPAVALQHYNKGVELFENKDYSGAKESLEKALGNASDIEVYHLLGKVYDAQGEYALAADCYSKAFSLDILNKQAWFDYLRAESSLRKQVRNKGAEEIKQKK